MASPRAFASVSPDIKVNATFTGSFSDVSLMDPGRPKTQIANGGISDRFLPERWLDRSAQPRMPAGVLWFGTQADQSSLAPYPGGLQPGL